MNAKSAKNPKTRTVITVGFVLILLSGGVFASGALEPKIVWSPPTINLPSLKPGETLTATAVFTNASLLNQKLDGNLSFAIANPNGATITATAKFPKSVKSGEKVPVTLKISVASSTPALPPRVISGNVRLVKIGGKTKDDKLGKLFEKSLGVNIAISSIPLPPFPNTADNNSTLLGIDSDANGVRDDIDWYVVMTYPDSAKIREALKQEARALGPFLRDANDKAKTRVNNLIQDKAYPCLVHVTGRDLVFADKTESALRAQFLNTKERSRAYNRADGQLGGFSSDDGLASEEVARDKASCSFDPDSFPN